MEFQLFLITASMASIAFLLIVIIDKLSDIIGILQ
ncbi:hypothetical protein PBI_NEBKISS_96 [Mycobacterium phage Nebkiss]|nr:hypothetical protein PBI_NEBKISS_96 [Mycobacterium phage Nebkiss]